MKHAILIMAHKNIEQLCKLVTYFGRDCEVFIHIDKKQTISITEKEALYKYKQVKSVVQKFEVFWGGTSVLECEMFLLRLALKQSDAEYYHLISGQDYPIKPLDTFLQFFINNQGKEFLQYIHLPNPRWEGNTFRRLQYFYPYDLAGNQPNPRQWVKEQVKIQYSKGIKRPIPDDFEHLYGGSQWFSITRSAVKTLLDYTDLHPAFYNRLWMTFAPEECYVTTVLLNILEKDNIVPHNCRFIRWVYENGNRPANLGKEHFHFLIESDSLFARKFEKGCSTDLLNSIDNYLLKDSTINVLTNGGWNYNGYLQYGFNNDFCMFITQLYWEESVQLALDMGCGAGCYVAAWRRCGLLFAGYDANPNTPSLSSLLLSDKDTPCGVADLTSKITITKPFDLVVCKDVIQYIPTRKIKKAIKNLTHLSSNIIVLSWNTPNDNTALIANSTTKNKLLSMFEQEGFAMDKNLTVKMEIKLRNHNCCIFRRQQ